MPTVNPTLPNDGEDADAADVSGPIQAILAVLNGHLDVDNIEPGALPWSVMDTSIANAIPATAMKDNANIITSRDEVDFDFVASGCVWSADAAGSTLAASMTAGVAYINGKRATVALVAARAFTASKDTYIDVKLNPDATMSLVYTEVANNAASPALDTDSIRIGIIVTGAGSIAAAGSVNQGQEDKVLPISSSTPYAVTDSLGNLICPRDPNRKTLGYRQLNSSNFVAGSSSSATDVTGLLMPIIVPTGRKVRLHIYGNIYNATNANSAIMELLEGASLLQQAKSTLTTANVPTFSHLVFEHTPSAGLHTYKAAIQCSSGAAVMGIEISSTELAFIKAELV